MIQSPHVPSIPTHGTNMIKRNPLLALAMTAAAAIAAGCAPISSTSVSQASQGVQSHAGASGVSALKAIHCDTPQMTVSLSPLQCKASSCQTRNQGTGNMAALIAYAQEKEGIPDLSGFGAGMTDMLTSALTATGCFDVLDRELLAELAREQQLAGKKVSLAGADIMATGSITSLTFDKANSSFGGFVSPALGGLSTSKVTAKIGMDVRLVDVNTGRVAYTQTYKAESGKRNYGVAGGGLIGSGLFGGSHSVKGAVEIEAAAREVINNVAFDMAEKMLPAGTYRITHTQ